MPQEVFQLATVTCVFADEVELAEAIGFPEISALDDAERKWRDCLQAKASTVLEDNALSPALGLHRRRVAIVPEVDTVELVFEPTRRTADWEQPCLVTVHYVRWTEAELHHGLVPGLGVHVFATRASLIPERVEAHLRLVLAGRGRKLTLRRLAELARVTELRVGQLEVVANRKTPKQLAQAGEVVAEKKSVLETLAEELPPIVPRADEGNKPPSDELTAVPVAFELEAELQQLAEALSGPHRRSVLIVGPPGSGKTALVRELARRRKDFGFGYTPFWSTSGARLMTGPIGFGMWQERCQEMCRELSRSHGIMHLGNLAEARPHLEQSLAIWKEILTNRQYQNNDRHRDIEQQAQQPPQEGFGARMKDIIIEKSGNFIRCSALKNAGNGMPDIGERPTFHITVITCNG